MDKKIEKPFINPIRLSKKMTILLVIWFIIGGIVTFYIYEYQWDKMINTYQLVNKKSEFEGVVFDIYRQKFTCVNLNNKLYLRFNSLWNDAYEPYDFHPFVQLNDSLSKRAYSDTLYVYRDGKKYFFVANPLYYPGWE